MTVSIIEVEPGYDEYINEAWNIKEEIREKQGYLHQSSHFFNDTYIDGHAYLLLTDQDLVGFAIMVERSYLAVLGIDPRYQGKGYGKKIMNEIVSDYDNISCHTRVSNTKAITFYEDLEFEIIDEEEDYYGDGEDAVILQRAKE